MSFVAHLLFMLGERAMGLVISLNDRFSFVTTAILAGVLGLCVGSFLNVVIYRLPRGESLSFPPSHCTACGYQLRWYDNIPLLSYLLLRGRCRNCHAHISVRYPLVEAAVAVLWVGAVCLWRTNILMAAVAALASSVLICIFWIDMEHSVIPDRFLVILLLLAVPATALDLWEPWYSHLIGAVAGGLALLLVGYLVSKWIGHEALGLGDVKLVAVSGAVLGWKRLLLMLLVASVGGSLILLIGRRKKARGEFPFAPFLTVGFLVALFAGDRLISAYLSLFVF